MYPNTEASPVTKDIIDNFKKRVDLDEISHAHIIVGENGIGKSTLITEFLKNKKNIFFPPNLILA